MSDDGRYVTFECADGNLVAGDTNGTADVFVRDCVNGVTTRVSVSSAGGEANGQSWVGTVSRDGRFVAFNSLASNLTPGDTKGQCDVFVHNLASGETRRVSLSDSDTEVAGDSSNPAISGDGRYVAFFSQASGLVPNDNNDGGDYFVRDCVTNETSMVSISSTGSQSPSDFTVPFELCSISEDGRYIAFDWRDPNFVAGDTNGSFDVFVRDRVAGTTTRASVDSQGVGAEGFSIAAKLSASGRYMAFMSQAGNLVAGDTNNNFDIFWHDMMPSDVPVLSTTTLVLKSHSTSTVGFGRSFAIRGRLACGGQGLAGKKVILQSAPSGGQFRDALLATTDASGYFSVAVSPRTRTRYRCRFAGSDGYALAGPTASITVIPKVSLGAPVAPLTMRVHKYYTVYGSLKPRHTSGTKPVRIYKYKKVSGKWKSYGYTTAKAYNYSTYSRYKASIKLTSKGRWRLRAYAPADSKHAATWSAKYDYVTAK